MLAVEIMRGAEEFFLRGGGKGVLLLHGYTGSPAEMRLLGAYLHRAGHTVLAVRLPGHGTTPEELQGMDWPGWYAEAERGYHRLRASCAAVSVVGLSMGGLLAVRLAARLPVAGLVLLSVPVFVRDARAPLLPVLKYFLGYLRKRKPDWQMGEEYNAAYERMPVRPLASLFELIGLCKKMLPQVTAPCLIMQSKVERTVQPRSAAYIYGQLGSSVKQLLWLERSGHILTMDAERDKVFQAIGSFLAQQAL